MIGILVGLGLFAVLGRRIQIERRELDCELAGHDWERRKHESFFGAITLTGLGDYSYSVCKKCGQERDGWWYSG